MFPFRGYQLDGVLCWVFLFLPSKVHADAINDLQYCKGKMATMSEMSLKMGLKFNLERNTRTKQGIKKNCTINELKMVNFYDSFTNLYMRFFLFCLEQYAWLGSSGFPDLFGTEVS